MAVWPSYSSTKQRVSLSFTYFSRIHHSACSRLRLRPGWSSQSPMVVHLVGLGGSLEGRVAGVVLVLVGCRGNRKSVVSFFVTHMCVLRC
jgi:hypothetical protein